MYIPNTYYVLDNVSTCPIVVPLKDYSRKMALEHPNEGSFEKVAKHIQEHWNSIQQVTSQDNERIKIFYTMNEWV